MMETLQGGGHRVLLSDGSWFWWEAELWGVYGGGDHAGEALQEYGQGWGWGGHQAGQGLSNISPRFLKRAKKACMYVYCIPFTALSCKLPYLKLKLIKSSKTFQLYRSLWRSAPTSLMTRSRWPSVSSTPAGTTSWTTGSSVRWSDRRFG